MSIWPHLESTYTHSAVLAAWREGLGELTESFRARYLEPEPGLRGKSYPCPRQCGCAHEIVHHSPSDVVAVCRCEPWRCDDLKLSAQDAVLWRLSWSRLGRALCQCFSLDTKPAELGIFNTRQIGSWSSAAVPAILTIQPESRGLHEVSLQLVGRLQQPFILFSPTARHLDALTLESLARVKAAFFDLQTQVRVSSAAVLTPAQAPGNLFQAFTAKDRDEDQSVFQKAFALVKALDEPGRRATLTTVTVFSEYCMAGLSISEIARKFGCSRGTVLNRLARLEKTTGMKPDRLRQFSSHIGRLEDQLTDSRAARLHRRRFIDDSDEPGD
jgi:predicted DNA-binding protein YlxM (UPF0122 family)